MSKVNESRRQVFDNYYTKRIWSECFDECFKRHIACDGLLDHDLAQVTSTNFSHDHGSKQYMKSSRINSKDTINTPVSSSFKLTVTGFLDVFIFILKPATG